MEALNNLLHFANTCPPGESELAVTRVFEHMVSHMDEFKAHSTVLAAARRILLDLVVVKGWQEGRQFFPHFAINPVQESFFTIRSLTGLTKSGFEPSIRECK